MYTTADRDSSAASKGERRAVGVAVPSKPRWWFGVRRYFYVVSLVTKIICVLLLLTVAAIICTVHVPIYATLNSIKKIDVPSYTHVVFSLPFSQARIGGGASFLTSSVSAHGFAEGTVVTRFPTGELHTDGRFHVAATQPSDDEVESAAGGFRDKYYGSEDGVFNETFDAGNSSNGTTHLDESLLPAVCVTEAADDLRQDYVTAQHALLNITVDPAALNVSSALLFALPATSSKNTSRVRWIVACRNAIETPMTIGPGRDVAYERTSLRVVLSWGSNTSRASAWLALTGGVLSVKDVTRLVLATKDAAAHSSEDVAEFLVVGTNRTVPAMTDKTESVSVIRIRLNHTCSDDNDDDPSTCKATLTAVGDIVAALPPLPSGSWSTASIVDNPSTPSLVLSSSSGVLAVCSLSVPPANATANAKVFASTLTQLTTALNLCGMPLQLLHADAVVGGTASPTELILLLANRHDQTSCMMPLAQTSGAAAADDVTTSSVSPRFSSRVSVVRYAVALHSFSSVVAVSSANHSLLKQLDDAADSAVSGVWRGAPIASPASYRWVMSIAAASSDGFVLAVSADVFKVNTLFCVRMEWCGGFGTQGVVAPQGVKPSSLTVAVSGTVSLSTIYKAYDASQAWSLAAVTSTAVDDHPHFPFFGEVCVGPLSQSLVVRQAIRGGSVLFGGGGGLLGHTATCFGVVVGNDDVLLS